MKKAPARKQLTVVLACAFVFALATLVAFIDGPSRRPRARRAEALTARAPVAEPAPVKRGRTCETDRVEQPPVTLTTSLAPSAGTRALQRLLSDRLERAALTDPLYEASGACRDLNSADETCLQPLSNLFFSALADTAAAFIESHDFELLTAVDEAGIDAYVAGLTTLYETATSRSERLSALVLLRHTPGVPASSLPELAYLGLPEMTDPEIQLVLAPHSSVPMPSEASARAVHGLAADTSRPGRVRVDASRALGHPEQAELLAELVANIEAEGHATPLQLMSALPLALAGCREACADSIAMLLRSDAKYARRIALRALSLMPEGSFVDEMLALSPPRFGDARAEMHFSGGSSVVAEL